MPGLEGCPNDTNTLAFVWQAYVESTQSNGRHTFASCTQLAVNHSVSSFGFQCCYQWQASKPGKEFAPLYIVKLHRLIFSVLSPSLFLFASAVLELNIKVGL